MNNLFKKLVTIFLTALILLSLSACTDTPIEKPIDVYMVDGNTPVKDITPKFYYYTEGLKITNMGTDSFVLRHKHDYDLGYDYLVNYYTGATVTNANNCKYLYFPNEIEGDPVIQCNYMYRDSVESNDLETLFFSDGIVALAIGREDTFSPDRLKFSAVIPESVVHAYMGTALLENLFYLGSKESFARIEFRYLLTLLYGEEFFETRGGVEPTHIYYYSETEPEESGVYWHYVDGLPVVWQ